MYYDEWFEMDTSYYPFKINYVHFFFRKKKYFKK